MKLPRLLVCLVLAGVPAHASQLEPDRVLAQSLIDVAQLRLPDALSKIEKLTSAHPNFRLAQLIKGDLLLAHARPGTVIVTRSGMPSVSVTGRTGNASRELTAYTSTWLPSESSIWRKYPSR